MNIVWGYNGTIIPLLPYSVFFSSDHILIEYLRTNNCLSFEKKLLASLMLKYDQCSAGQKWLRKSIGSIITGQPSQMLENVAKILSAKISESVVDVMRQLHAAGFELYIVSCSTDSLLKNSLYFKGVDNLFRGIVGNQVTSYDGQIVDYTCRFSTGQDKVAFVEESMHLSPENTIVIGTSQDDIPLLEWSRYPILVDSTLEGWKKYEEINFIFMESTKMLANIVKSLV